MNRKITLNNIYYRYGKNQIISNLKLTIFEGQLVFIKGNSGSGKTTLLKLMSKQLTPARGSILINGKKISCLLTDTVLDKLSPLHNTILPLKAKTDNFSKYIPQCLELLQALEIPDIKQESQILTNSQRYMLNFAQRIVIKPDILILDNPFSALDLNYLSILITALINLNKSGTTIVVTAYTLDGIYHKLKTIDYLEYQLSGNGELVNNTTFGELISNAK